MKPLSGLDNLFLHMEHGNQYMHVASVGIYDQRTAPGGSVRFKQILDFFSDRIRHQKVFRRRLVVPPFGIGRPYWVEDGEIDVEFHVRHVALPAPGDWRQLMIQVARVHSRPLDRSKPLWEAYVIEGLDNIPGIAKGSFAFYSKFHHAAVDGEAGAQILQTIHSLTNEIESSFAQPSVVVADREPTLLELYSRAITSRGAQLLDAGKLLAELGGRTVQAGANLAASGKLVELGQTLLTEDGAEKLRHIAMEAASAFKRKPATRFDEKVSPHRVVDAMFMSLDDCATVRAHVPHVTINDIFIATCGGAVRRYLDSKGELPGESLSALMPISTRGANKNADVGNQVGMVPVPVCSDIADPVDRLHAAHKGARLAAGLSASLGHDFTAKLVQVVPAMVAESIIERGLVPLCNTTVSNVRGPSVPLYLAGAKLQIFLPVSIAFNGIGLNMTGFSYNGALWVCFVACRNMLPDPRFFRQCLIDSFAEILDAARKLPPHGQKAAKAGPGKARTKVAKVALSPPPYTTEEPAAKARARARPKGKRRVTAKKSARIQRPSASGKIAK
jgi:diacylglycerol O-acyltransferase